MTYMSCLSSASIILLCVECRYGCLSVQSRPQQRRKLTRRKRVAADRAAQICKLLVAPASSVEHVYDEIAMRKYFVEYLSWARFDVWWGL